MTLQYPPLRLVNAGVAISEQQQAMRVRRGYWIQRARKRKKLTLQAVGQLLGYPGKSESIVSRWEAGARPVPSDKLEPLARLLDLLPKYLVNPPLTDDERLDEAIRDAAEQERGEWDEEEGTGPKADAGPAGARRTHAA